MKLRIKNMNYGTARKFQEGGQMAPETEAPVDEVPVGQAQEAPQEQDPMMVMAQTAMQALQNNDCQAAMQVCEMFIQLIQEAQGRAPQQEEPQGEPVYRAGGKLAYRIRK